LSAPPPPGWVWALLGGLPRAEVQKAGDGVEVEVRASGSFAFLRVTAPGAGALDDDAFGRAVARAYGAIAEALAERGWHALRVWNFVPGIRLPARTAGSRYEVFNAGRQAAWLLRGRGRDFAARLPAASAVDPHGEDLVVEALAGSAPGRPVENPRQIPAYRYSSRYGAQPPWFSRATLLPRNPLGGRGRLALVSGTASVRGEDTQHPGDLAAQVEETLCNLAALAAAFSSAPRSARPDPAQAAAELARYRWLRVYVVRESDAPAVLERVSARFGALEALELVVADLCRSDLLLEIEGTAVGDR
jgi:chorismate lyase/3-hydroxybenzoate synthase